MTENYLRQLHISTCPTTGKHSYRDRKTARKVRQRGSHRHGNPYQCTHCGYWHLGRYHRANTRAQYRGGDTNEITTTEAAQGLGVQETQLLWALEHMGYDTTQPTIDRTLYADLHQRMYGYTP